MLWYTFWHLDTHLNDIQPNDDQHNNKLKITFSK